jgi:hypothetical protein
MKKVKLKVVLGALSLAFFLFLGMSQVGAQSATTIGTGVPSVKPGSSGSGSSTILVAPQGNFYGTDDALSILANELGLLKDQLSQLTSGSPVYASVEIKYVYYSNIDQSLRAGATVPNAIVEGLQPLTTDAYGPVSQANLVILRQSAISLLTI